MYERVDRGGNIWPVVLVTENLIFWTFSLLAIEQGIIDYNEATGGGDEGGDAEWYRRQTLLDELIFNGSPDPGDDDQFRAVIQRALLYGGVTASALARAVGVTPATMSRWGNDDSSIPRSRLMREGVIGVLRKMILGL